MGVHSQPGGLPRNGLIAERPLEATKPTQHLRQRIGNHLIQNLSAFKNWGYGQGFEFRTTNLTNHTNPIA